MPGVDCNSISSSRSARRRDEPPRGHDDPMTILPLDRLHPSKPRNRAAAGDLENVAVAIFDQRTAPAHVQDPIRHDLLRRFWFG
jgi:hypothetical protein